MLRTAMASPIFHALLLVVLLHVQYAFAQKSPPPVSPLGPANLRASDGKPVSPDSPVAERLAERKAKRLRGEPVKSVGFGPDLSKPIKVAGADFVPQYRGTVVEPHPSAEGQVLTIQRNFISALAAADLQPASRHRHFAWLPKVDHLRFLGWYGIIQDSELLSDGIWIFKVKLTPWLYSPYMRSTVADDVLETYSYDGKKFKLIYSDADIPKPEQQRFLLPAAR